MAKRIWLEHRIHIRRGGREFKSPPRYYEKGQHVCWPFFMHFIECKYIWYSTTPPPQPLFYNPHVHNGSRNPVG